MKTTTTTTTPTTTHTPDASRWFADGDIISVPSGNIADCANEKIAAFIVTACNSHHANLARIAELEAALRESKNIRGLLSDAAGMMDRLTGDNLAIYARTFSALARAALQGGDQ